MSGSAPPPTACRRLIVTRHPGAVEWLRRRPCLRRAESTAHLCEADIRRGDSVFGVLPLALAARICAAGGQVYGITYDMPPSARGVELDADALDRYGARLVQYHVRELGGGDG